MTGIQIVISVFALFAFTRTILQFKKGRLTFVWLLFWMLFWLGAVFVAVLPTTADMLAQFFGVGRGADVVIYLSLLVMFYLLFRVYVKIEQVETEITRLVRNRSIDEWKNKSNDV